MLSKVSNRPAGFDELTVEEKLDYVEALWGRIAATPETVPLPDWHLEVIEQRLGVRSHKGRRIGRGDEFLDELDSVLCRVIKDPFQFPKIKSQIRRALLRRFPYSIYFDVAGETLELVAVLHQRRTPRAWEKRLIAE